MLLEGKRLVITGVLTDDSIAWHTARIALEEGAQIVLTGFGRGMRLTERVAGRTDGADDDGRAHRFQQPSQDKDLAKAA